MYNFGSLFYLMLQGICLLIARIIALINGKQHNGVSMWREKARRCVYWMLWMEGEGTHPKNIK